MFIAHYLFTNKGVQIIFAETRKKYYRSIYKFVYYRFDKSRLIESIQLMRQF